MDHSEGTPATGQTQEDTVIAWGYRLPDPAQAWLPGTLDKWEAGIDAAIQRMLEEGRTA